MIDLKKLEEKFDAFFKKETEQSFNEFVKNKIIMEKEKAIDTEQLQKLLKNITQMEWQDNGLSVKAFGKGIIAICPTPKDNGLFECSYNADLIKLAPTLAQEVIELREENETITFDAQSLATDKNRLEEQNELLKQALGAIVARLNGDWDNEALNKYGELSDCNTDIGNIAADALRGIKY